MARLLQVALDQHAVVAEAGGGLALAGGQRVEEGAGRFDHAHALAAAAGAGLDQHRIADGVGLRLEELRVLIVAVVAGHQRHAGFSISDLAADLLPMAAMAEAGGPTKAMPASVAAWAKASFSDRKP